MTKILGYIFIAIIIAALSVLAFGPFILGMMDKSHNKNGTDHALKNGRGK